VHRAADERQTTTMTREGVRAIAEHLVIQAKVYGCADRLFLDKVRDVALNKFKEVSNRIILEPEFAAVLETVFEETHPGDELRYFVVELCCINAKGIEVGSEVDVKLTAKEPMAWRLQRRWVASVQISAASARSQLALAQATIVRLNRQAVTQTRAMAKVTARIAEFKSKLATDPMCPTCEEYYSDNPPLEFRYDKPRGFLVKCGGCQVERTLD
jgi:hypothetical protein